MPSALPAKMFPKSEQTELDNYKLQVEILQQKLAKSEEQRQQLEEKFEKIQKKRSENEKSIKARSRAKFEEFLDKQRERNERNKKIIRMLEHIDQQAALLAQRSSRLKAMKRQYELYFARLLQSQAFRIQQSPRYSFLPINQYPTLTQANDINPMLETKGKASELSPAMLTSQDNTGIQNIPSITTIPATPPGNLTPRTQASIQSLPLSADMENWNYLPQTNNYSVSALSNAIPNLLNKMPSNISMQNPRFAMNNAISPLLGNNFNYSMQPNPLDFYRGQGLYNFPNTSKIQTGETLPQQPWGYPNFPFYGNIGSSPRNINPYTDTGFLPNKTDMEDPMAFHRATQPGQRTFKDYNKSGQPIRNFEKKYLSEPEIMRSESDYSKSAEDDLGLRELNPRHRMRTFNDSNENLSHELNQEPYYYGRKDTHDPRTIASPTELHNRYLPRSSHSRSSSVENKVLTATKQPQQDENYIPPQSRGGSNERTTTFSNIQPSNRTNVTNDRLNMNPRDSESSRTVNPSHTFDNIQRQGEILKNPQYAEEMSSPPLSSIAAGSKPYNQHQQYNNQANSPSISTIPTSETAGDVNGTVISNSDKIMLPSKNYKSSISANPDSIHSNNDISSSSISSPYTYNDDASLTDKKQRPALLKKIQIPDYLSPKSNVEKSKLNSERTDTDILRLHQPSGADSLPIQFAKKEKLTLENIENVMYGELINPEIPMSSGGPSNAVTQVLRQHQTPAEILAQTNQGRKPTLENYKQPLTNFNDAPQTYIENQTEKSDISEKLLKNKIETPNTKTLNMNLEKLKINEPVISQKQKTPSPVTPPTPMTEISKFNKLPETAIRENVIPKTPEISQNNYENFDPVQQERIIEPTRKAEPSEVEKVQMDTKPTFDYENSVSENINDYNTNPEISPDVYEGQDQYQNDVDVTNVQETLDTNQTYSEPQNYTDLSKPSENEYQTDQQQYDNTQNYEQYDPQNYTQDQQNPYENYQTEYDPNAYNYNYDQQQSDGTYAAYDPNQQYSEQDYSQQGYQDPNYTEQQYNEQNYIGDQNQGEQNQYDYSQQNIPTESYDQQQTEQNLINQNESIPEQQPEPSKISTPATPPSNSGPKGSSKSVKPILTKEKSVDVDSKKKKRVNFIDSSDESSRAQQQQQQPTTTDESDFDFSSQ